MKPNEQLAGDADGIRACGGLVGWRMQLAFLVPVILASAYFAAGPLIPKQHICSQMDADLFSIEAALEMYKLNTGNFPETTQGLQALVKIPVEEPVPKHWKQVMDRVYPDPWGNPYRYKSPGSRDPSKPEVISMGPDGMEGTSDDMSSEDE